MKFNKSRRNSLRCGDSQSNASDTNSVGIDVNGIELTFVRKTILVLYDKKKRYENRFSIAIGRFVAVCYFNSIIRIINSVCFSTIDCHFNQTQPLFVVKLFLKSDLITTQCFSLLHDFTFVS
jgi:hypothetical protein